MALFLNSLKSQQIFLLSLAKICVSTNRSAWDTSEITHNILQEIIACTDQS